MQVERLGLPGLALITLKIYRDERGFFVERFQEERFEQHGLPTRFIQDNHSRSLPGVLRGLHFQTGTGQGKLIGVSRGRIWDVAVDIRPESQTFGQSFAIELSDENGLVLWIPAGFAHGFCTLGTEAADVLYKVDAPYDPASEGGIHWADPELALAWPLDSPLVSARDEKLASFAAYRARFNNRR
jgi:dTDP-4-dehydrorhamnose 3,5-epimerase